MKQVYVKPDIYVEYFTLNQNIASSCGVTGDDSQTSLGDPNHWSKTTCGWAMDDDGFIVLFLDTRKDICNEYLEENEEINGVCYNAPTGGNIFSS